MSSLADAGISEPSTWVRRWAHLVPASGAVLDVACGQGRHSRFFAEAGCRVTAIDRDAEALARLPDGVRRICVDIEGALWPLDDGEQFAAVVVTNYLFRPLLPRLVQCVAPGGVLIYETFAAGQERIGRPSNPDFLLQPGELLAAVADTLRVVAYEDGYTETPRPAFIQRICAVHPNGGDEVRHELHP